MIKAAIFDLDGTLSDSIMSMKYSGDKTMAEFGYGPFSVQDYKYFVGDGAANLVKRALIKGGDTELTHFEAAYARYKEIFQANCMYQVKPYEGIPKLLEELKKRGMKIAVLSNKPHHATVDVIESLFGKGYFDVVQGRRAHQARSRRSLPHLRPVRSHRRRSALHGRHCHRYEDRQGSRCLHRRCPLGLP